MLPENCSSFFRLRYAKIRLKRPFIFSTVLTVPLVSMILV
nr:MAG TPA: hypothetical protein [Caudoviricetes sp.]